MIDTKLSENILKSLNKLFPKQRHPFNLENDGEETYTQWQYEKGDDTISQYLPRYTCEDILGGKSVLDMGCGAGGKSVYYIVHGASHVTGVDMVDGYKEAAEAFAKKMGCEDKFTFIKGNACALSIPDNTFDAVIMNDFFEHVSEPELAVKESLRLLKPGGRLYINFPPYGHPFGAHLSDAIQMPWVHLFFSEKTMVNVYCDLVKDLPGGQRRIDFRFSKGDDGRYHMTYINKMTIKRAKKILRSLQIEPEYMRFTPLRKIFTPLAHVPLLREVFAKNVTCVICKQK